MFLPGYACTSDIWDDIKTKMDENDLGADYVNWPREKLNDFSSTNDFAKWLNEQYDLDSYDTIIGHSMGGLVAIDLADKNLFTDKRLILVESFFKTPSKFFRNLYLKNANQSLKDKIELMLKEESTYYNKALSEKLKDLDKFDEIKNLNSEIICFYGAREESNKKFVINQLNLDEGNLEKLKIKVVSQSSHFPMLENPEEFFTKLIDILG